MAIALKCAYEAPAVSDGTPAAPGTAHGTAKALNSRLVDPLSP